MHYPQRTAAPLLLLALLAITSTAGAQPTLLRQTALGGSKEGRAPTIISTRDGGSIILSTAVSKG